VKGGGWGNVTLMEGMRNVHVVLVGDPEEQITLGTFQLR